MKLQSVQVLRGLAAFLVLIYHIRAIEAQSILGHGSTERPWIGGLFTNGYAGVDLFFVISGFIMVYVTHGLKQGLHTAGDFFFARLTRIFPVWWAFAAFMTLYLIVVHGLLPGGLGWDVLARGQPPVSFFAKSFLLLPQPVHPVLGVGWTLVHEIYFYITFSLLLLLVRRRLWPIALVAWGLAIVAGSLAGLSSAYAGTIVQLIFHPMTMEFILGAAMGLCVLSSLAWRPGLVTLIGTLWLMGSLCYQGLETQHTLGWGRVIWFGLPSAMLIFGLASIDLTNRLAWLVPAATAAITATVIYQMYGLLDTSSHDERLGATIVALTVASLVLLATLWLGWLGGQTAPERVAALGAPLSRVLNALARLGDWSFSLYLGHIIVLSALKRAFGLVGQIDLLAPVFKLGHPGRLDNIVFVIVAIVAALVFAALTYRFIEKPAILIFGRMRERLFYRDTAAPAAAPQIAEATDASVSGARV